MAIKKVRIRPEGGNNYADVLHPETSADVVIESENRMFVSNAEKTNWNNKADKTYVDTELNKRYLKEQVFTKEEVLQKIQDVIGAAPEALDTLQEIAEALNNDANFAGTITNELSKKVDKITGKQLSTEDYTTAEKNKLAGIEAGANKYTHPSTHPASMITESTSRRFVSDSEKVTWNNKQDALGYTPVNKAGDTITGDIKLYATPSNTSRTLRMGDRDGSYGFDIKYNGEGSGVNNTLQVWSDNQNTGSPIQALEINQDGLVKFSKTPQVANSNISLEGHTHDSRYYTESEIDTKLSGKVDNSRVLTDVPANAKFTDTTYSEISTSEIDAGTSSTRRTITGRRVKYILDKIQGWLNNKVDKIEGKGLSTEDYTSAEKTKLSGIESGANKYTHPSTHSASMITETTTKRFVSDAEKNTWNTVTSKADLTYVNTELNKKVDKISGKGLSTEDYTSAEKTKLSGIEAGAEVNQNAFSNIKVGTTTIAADSKTDTLELTAGTGITLTPDATNDKVTVSVASAPKLTTARTISLSGDVSGSTSFDGSANVTITATVADDSHNHVISNIDGLQAALDAKETPAGAQTKADSALASAKNYTDTKVAGVVNSAPEALDTLYELAEALGNDPNFATTVMTEIGTKETPDGAQAKVDAHANLTNNPHSVTKSQVGLGSVSNYGLATQAEAEAGTSSAKYMTPLRTKQAIDALQAVKSVAGKTGTVTLTKGDVGLSNVDNTSDMDKPISTAVQTALNGKVDNSRVLTDVPSNAKFTDTTYSEISTSEIDAGTSSTRRTITGRRVKYILDKIQDWLNNKVDKIEGKGLSTEDYTSAEKTKLSGIESGANKYTHPSTHSASMITETTTKRFVSDAEKNTWNTVTSKADLTYVNTELNKKVDKISGKGLSTEDYTSAEKTKLSGIEAGAEVNQNAFSNIKVGTTTIAADSKTDTLELTAGTGITLTPDATNDKVTVSVASAPKLTTARTISLSGDVSGSTSFDGSANVTITATVADDSHNHVISNIDGLQAALDAKETPAGAQTKADSALASAKNYTDTKVAGVVNSAPEALDTLYELAEALGNDPNFATTVMTEIGTKETPDGAQAKVDAHANLTNNPHSVTKSQVGLGSVSNYGLATQAEAEAGTSSAKYMTPLRTKQAIDALQAVKSVAGKTGVVTVTKSDVGLSNVDNVKQASKTEFDAHTSNKSNPHSVTKSQVGLGNVQNYGIATQAEAEAGTSNAKYMTPLRVKQAIDKFKPKDTSELTKSDVYTKNEVDAKLDEKVDNSRVLTNVPANAKFTDTTYSEISEAEIDAGTSSSRRTITGRRIKYIIDKIQAFIPIKVSQLENDKNYVTQSDLDNAGYGDMIKSIYDKNNNGIVDNAEKVNGYNVNQNLRKTDTVQFAKVGVGTSTPNESVDIVGNARIRSEGSMKFGGTGANDAAFEIKYNNSTKSLDFNFLL